MITLTQDEQTVLDNMNSRRQAMTETEDIIDAAPAAPKEVVELADRINGLAYDKTEEDLMKQNRLLYSKMLKEELEEEALTYDYLVWSKNLKEEYYKELINAIRVRIEIGDYTTEFFETGVKKVEFYGAYATEFFEIDQNKFEDATAKLKLNAPQEVVEASNRLESIVCDADLVEENRLLYSKMLKKEELEEEIMYCDHLIGLNDMEKEYYKELINAIRVRIEIGDYTKLTYGKNNIEVSLEEKQFLDILNAAARETAVKKLDPVEEKMEDVLSQPYKNLTEEEQYLFITHYLNIGTVPPSKYLNEVKWFLVSAGTKWTAMKNKYGVKKVEKVVVKKPVRDITNLELPVKDISWADLRISWKDYKFTKYADMLIWWRENKPVKKAVKKVVVRDITNLELPGKNIPWAYIRIGWRDYKFTTYADMRAWWRENKPVKKVVDATPRNRTDEDNKELAKELVAEGRTTFRAVQKVWRKHFSSYVNNTESESFLYFWKTYKTLIKSTKKESEGK